MQKKIKILYSFLVLLFIGGEAFAESPLNNRQSKRLTIVFTSDMHSSALARSNEYSQKGIGGQSIVGGYTRLASQIERERQIAKDKGEAFICVDAGDIAMGTIFHSIYVSHAFELRSMAKMSYDAICMGNHDFDLGLDSLAKMYSTAYNNERHLPKLVCANLSFANSSKLNNALKQISFSPYVIIEKNGLKIAIIGVMGKEAYSSIVDKENIKYSLAKDAIKPIVKQLKNANVDFIVLLSHSGTFHNKSVLRSEDAILANKIDNIDVIISGHDHIELKAPIMVNNTLIGNVGANANYLGKVSVYKDSLSNKNHFSYSLIPIVDTNREQPKIKIWLDSIKTIVSKKFYSSFGVYPFDTIAHISNTYNLLPDKNGNLALGSLIAKSYKKAVIDNISGIKENELVSVIPYGTIRNKLESSYVNYNDVFNILSLGSDSKGRVGYPLVLAYLSGKELKDACELNASIAPYFKDALLFFDGLSFEYNSYRPMFARVCKVKVGGKDIVNSKLYPVVSGMYTAKLLGLLRTESYGILKATLKDRNGNKVDNLEDMVVMRKDSVEIPVAEWLAFADYIKSEDISNFKDNGILTSLDRNNIGAISWHFLIVFILLSPFIYIIIRIKRNRYRA